MSDIDQIQQQLKQLRLTHLAAGLRDQIDLAQANELSYCAFLANICALEVDQRNRKRMALNYRQACLPCIKTLDEFDYRVQTTITKRQVNELLDFSFIDQRQNLIFIGPPGVGKTHLAIGIADKALRAGYKVLFKTAMELIELLELATLRGELKQRLNQLIKYDVLIIDELGYLPMSKQSNHHLFQLVDKLYEFRSIILTTNKEFTQWGEFFLDENVAVPVVDRLVHHSKIFMLGGESYRLKQKKTI